MVISQHASAASGLGCDFLRRIGMRAAGPSQATKAARETCFVAVRRLSTKLACTSARRLACGFFRTPTKPWMVPACRDAVDQSHDSMQRHTKVNAWGFTCFTRYNYRMTQPNPRQWQMSAYGMG